MATPATSGREGPEMGKPTAERRLDDTEASAFLRGLRISARKLNLVAQTIRGKDANKALAELTFSRRRIARSEEHTSELQSLAYLVCRLLLEKKKIPTHANIPRITHPL